MGTPKDPKEIVDQEGWHCGMRAIFRGIWGTDTEMRLHTGVEAEITHAQENIGDMRQGAQNLLNALDKPVKSDEIEEVLENIIRDL